MANKVDLFKLRADFETRCHYNGPLTEHDMRNRMEKIIPNQTVKCWNMVPKCALAPFFKWEVSMMVQVAAFACNNKFTEQQMLACIEWRNVKANTVEAKKQTAAKYFRECCQRSISNDHNHKAFNRYSYHIELKRWVYVNGDYWLSDTRRKIVNITEAEKENGCDILEIRRDKLGSMRWYYEGSDILRGGNTMHLRGKAAFPITVV